MKRSHRIFVYGIFEDLARIEEICNSVSFYFSKIYDMESKFGKRSKYAAISKQTIFLAIQRSNSLALDIIRRIETIEQNKIIEMGCFKERISELQCIVKSIERDYSQEKYEGIVEKLKGIGQRCDEMKNGFLVIL